MNENSITQYIKEVCIEENISFLQNKEKTDMLVCPTNIAKTKETSMWSISPLDIAISYLNEVLLNKESVNKCRFNVSMLFYEKIWLKCSIEEQKNLMIKMFKRNIVQSLENNFDNLNDFSSSDYINVIINAYFTRENFGKDKSKSTNKDTLTPIINCVKQKKLSLNLKNLSLTCANNSILKTLIGKNLLKDFIEIYYPDNIVNF